MDIDLPLVLVVLVFGTGIVWGFDRAVLLPGRRRAIEDFRTKKGLPLDVQDDIEDDRLRETIEALGKEPVVVEYAISFFPVLLLVLVLRSFLVEPFQIPTGSMIPTLMVGDFILVNKYTYGIRLPVLGTKVIDVDSPKSGDIMVFIPPHEDRYFIKRVIGVPGDRIRYVNKTLYINGQEATQEFLAQFPASRPSYMVHREEIGGVEHLIHRNLYDDEESREWVVPQGHYFMMGDNRDRSSDSRFWGMVPDENIVGKAFAIWVHKDPGWHLPNFSRNAWIQ